MLHYQNLLLLVLLQFLLQNLLLLLLVLLQCLHQSQVLLLLALLLFLGIKMIIEGLRKESDDKKAAGLTFPVLLLQGLATSIDALSVGFTISEYTFAQALVESLIIGAVTFGICLAGILVGRKAGGIFKKAPVIGGIILIAIGIEIFVSHMIK